MIEQKQELKEFDMKLVLELDRKVSTNDQIATFTQLPYPVYAGD